MDEIKTLIVVSLSSLAAYLSPISGVVFSVTLIFFINFLYGLWVARSVCKEDFSFKKAFACIKEAAFFLVLVSAAYSIGEHMENPDVALYYISLVTYVLMYFYTVNIFKNLKREFPESAWIAFVYYVISIEFAKRITFMDAYMKRKEENHGKD